MRGRPHTLSTKSSIAGPPSPLPPFPGGLSVLLHADYVAERIHAVNPSARVSALADCSFFIDATDVFGRPYAADAYGWVASTHNVTEGVGRINDACISMTPAPNRWQCFMAQFAYPHIKTPTFLIQSSEDAWQLPNLLAPIADGADASYFKCFVNPAKFCNATQLDQFLGYRTQWYTAFNASLAASPVAYAQNGATVTSCVKHSQASAGTWDVEQVDGVTLQQAFADWYAGRPSARGGAPSTGFGHFFYDGPWGSNPTCSGPMPGAWRLRGGLGGAAE